MYDQFKGTKLVIFDLDGTLYADTHHFDHYADITKRAMPMDKQDSFWTEYSAIREGNHPLQLGHFYDVTHDRILVVRQGRVIAAKTWGGEELPAAVADEYAVPLTADHSRILNVGDLWWVVSAAAAHHGLPGEVQGNCFLQCREWMMTPDYTIAPIAGLKETLEQLHGQVMLVLATNSPQPDSEIIINKCGLSGLFTRSIYRTNKPAGFIPAVQELMATHGLQPSEVLSVGDNLANEILPARLLGCRTAFIDPHQIGTPQDADLRTTTMEEILPYLQALV